MKNKRTFISPSVRDWYRVFVTFIFVDSSEFFWNNAVLIFPHSHREPFFYSGREFTFTSWRRGQSFISARKRTVDSNPIRRFFVSIPSPTPSWTVVSGWETVRNHVFSHGTQSRIAAYEFDKAYGTGVALTNNLWFSNRQKKKNNNNSLIRAPPWKHDYCYYNFCYFCVKYKEVPYYCNCLWALRPLFRPCHITGSKQKWKVT